MRSNVRGEVHPLTFSSLALLPSLLPSTLLSVLAPSHCAPRSNCIFHVEWLTTSIIVLFVLLRIIFFFFYHHYGPKDHINRSCNKNRILIHTHRLLFSFFSFLLFFISSLFLYNSFYLAPPHKLVHIFSLLLIQNGHFL